MNVYVKDCISGVKSLSDLFDSLVKYQTKGDVFLYRDELGGKEKMEAARKRAEELAREWIRESLDSLPRRIKRDMEI